MASTQQSICHAPSRTAYKAAVTYFSVMNRRLKQTEKPRPRTAAGEDRMPKHDPAAVLFPLMDAYAERARKGHMEDPRMSPMLAKLETLPKDVLLIVPGVDILVHEQLTFAERIGGRLRRIRMGRAAVGALRRWYMRKDFMGGQTVSAFRALWSSENTNHGSA